MLNEGADVDRVEESKSSLVELISIVELVSLARLDSVVELDTTSVLDTRAEDDSFPIVEVGRVVAVIVIEEESPSEELLPRTSELREDVVDIFVEE